MSSDWFSISMIAESEHGAIITLKGLPVQFYIKLGHGFALHDVVALELRKVNDLASRDQSKD